MKPITDLEALIRRLAGRDDAGGNIDAARNDRVQGQLDDPLSDASQFFDEIRRKTRSLFDEPTTLRPISDHPQALGMELLFGSKASSSSFQRRAMRPGWIILAFALLAAIAGVGAMAWRIADRSSTSRMTEQTERILQELRSQRVAQAEPVMPRPIDPVPNPADNLIALRRLEVELTSLNAKLDALSRSTTLRVVKANPPGADIGEAPAILARPQVAIPDPNSIAIGADLAAIRRELVNSEAATTRQIQEMRTVLQEVNTVVRRVLSRPQPSTNTPVALPILAIAVQALTNNLQHPSAQVRGEAIEQLVRLGTAARSAVPALQQLLGRETDPNIRSAIETALSVLSSN